MENEFLIRTRDYCFEDWKCIENEDTPLREETLVYTAYGKVQERGCGMDIDPIMKDDHCEHFRCTDR